MKAKLRRLAVPTVRRSVIEVESKQARNWQEKLEQARTQKGEPQLEALDIPKEAVEDSPSPNWKL
jgi:hypothetical protein